MLKPRTLIAVQFSLWAFFFGRLIPFSGTFLLPIVWIYDRRVFAGYLTVFSLESIQNLPGAISVVSGIPGMKMVPAIYLSALPILVVPLIAGQLAFDVWIGAWLLKRKMKTLAPDLTRFH